MPWRENCTWNNSAHSSAAHAHGRFTLKATFAFRKSPTQWHLDVEPDGP